MVVSGVKGTAMTMYRMACIVFRRDGCSRTRITERSVRTRDAHLRIVAVVTLVRLGRSFHQLLQKVRVSCEKRRGNIRFDDPWILVVEIIKFFSQGKILHKRTV